MTKVRRTSLASLIHTARKSTLEHRYSALGYWRRRELLGKPFWETDVELYDAVHDVGVRSHYRASVLAVRIMRNQARGGVIVNTNSPGCLLYSMNVPYGMGKCAIDKMSADMSVELDFDSSDVTVVSWWPKSPMRTWYSSAKRENLYDPLSHTITSVLLYQGYAIDRHHTHLYHKKITRIAKLKCTLKYYENLSRASRSNTGTEEIRTFSFDFSSILFRKLTRCIF